jgi:GTP-binding protein HflX
VKHININGNIGSLKDSVLNEIESIYDLEISSYDLIPVVLADKLAALTGKINREISVYINRKGSVIDISVGDSSTVSLPEFDGYKKKNRLSGIRCIHTHPNGDGRLSSVDISSLLSLRLDAMIALGVIDGVLTGSSFAFPVRDMNGEFTKADIYQVSDINDESINVLFMSVLDRERHLGDIIYNNESQAEKAVLVGMETWPDA